MNRRGDEEFLINLFKKIKQKVPSAILRTTLIVGFAGETEEDFNITYQNLIQTGLTKIHVFPFSARKGTIACSMPNQISDEDKKKRVKLVQQVSDEKLTAFLEKNISTENEVIIEKNRDKKSGLLKGITKNYINVLVNGDDSLKDTLQKVRLTAISDYSEKMHAEVI